MRQASKRGATSKGRKPTGSSRIGKRVASAKKAGTRKKASVKKKVRRAAERGKAVVAARIGSIKKRAKKKARKAKKAVKKTATRARKAARKSTDLDILAGLSSFAMGPAPRNSGRRNSVGRFDPSGMLGDA